MDDSREASAVNRRRILAAAGLGGLSTIAALPAARAQSQSWPNKPIRLITGFPAGSATDGISRALAEHLRTVLGQPVTVENRAGANGSLGAAEVARAASDGYTLLVTNSSSITVNPQIYRKLPYVPERDFVPLSRAVSAPFILVVNPAGDRTSGVNSLNDLLALARSKPGALTYGSGGPGNLAHLGFEMMNNKAGIQTRHVPYKSGVNAQLGLLGKEIDVLLDTPVTVPNIKAGKLKALAVTGPTRWRDLPEVPTLAEAGLPGVEITFWLGLFAPMGTPRAVLDILHNAIASARNDATAMQGLLRQGTVELTAPAQFAARIKAETASWGEVIRRENITLD
ncbi:MAG: Bug family tripartite tricarboxylate transporter substrate binding protein [Burkholderiales bacterium]